MGPLFATMDRNPFIIVFAAVGLLFIEVILLAGRRPGSAKTDGANPAKVTWRSRWLPILFAMICGITFLVGLVLMHSSTLITMFFGDQKVYDRQRAKMIIEELKTQESDKSKLLMLKELEVIVEDQSKE